MKIDNEKTYGELMSFLLQRRRQHGTDERFRAYVAESVQILAKDLRDFDLDVAVARRSARAEDRRRDFNALSVGCE